MEGTYNIHGAELVNPTVTIREIFHSVETGETNINTLIEDTDDSISFDVFDFSTPVSWTIEDLQSWTENQLQQYRV